MSLTGVGGSGKTRLAQQVGIRVAATFPHGVWFVDLAPVANPELLPGVVARALDVPEKALATIADALAEWLRPRHLLLILDNCEHLLDACAAFAASLLRSGPDVRILATSREALTSPAKRVGACRRWSFAGVGGARADGDARVRRRPAVRRSRRGGAAFRVTPENAAAVAEICRRLDGIPLAIELAAARVRCCRSTDPRPAATTASGCSPAAGDGAGAPADARAAVDWSYDLLSETERRLLARLSVFAGGWTLEAAEAVCAGGAIRRRRRARPAGSACRQVAGDRGRRSEP